MEKFLFVEGIQGAGRLIHQADIRIAEKDSGDADTLALASGKSGAHLTHIGGVSFGQCLDKVRDTGSLRRLPDLIQASLGFGNADIFGDGSIEKISVLLQKAMR